MTTIERPTLTTSNDFYSTKCASSDAVNWTYPTTHHYRAAGPKQPIPRGAHTPSSSIGSNTSYSSNAHSHSRSRSDFSTKGIDCPKASAVVARILEKDQATGTTYLAGCIAKEKEKSKPACTNPPPRVESRRALLSMANGSKAPFLLRGPSTSSRIAIEGKRGQVVRLPPPPPVPSSSTTTTVTTRYLHKELPPTPPSSTSSAQPHSPTGTDPKKPISPTTIPSTKPLNLTLAASVSAGTLAAKRLTRARARQNGGSLALSRFRAVPAPIRLPKLNGPSAFNGPLSAHSMSDSEEMEMEEIDIPEDIEELALGSPLLPREKEEMKKGATPLGDLPITPLDIPVDWDDLQERWTSPVHLSTEEIKEENSKAALEAFRQDVNELFAPSPSIDVRGSMFYSGQETVEGVLSEEKEKRHGKVMVKKELKLCLDLDMKRKKSRRGYKKGESFLMMNSPLSPETARSIVF